MDEVDHSDGVTAAAGPPTVTALIERARVPPATPFELRNGAITCFTQLDQDLALASLRRRLVPRGVALLTTR